MLENHHKQLVQYFLHDGAYNEQELIDLVGSLRDRYELKIRTQDEIRTFVEVYLPIMNKHLQEFGIEIKQVTSEENENDNYFVCTQNFKSQFVKLDCSYTEREAAVFEKLLEVILTSDEKCVVSREVFEVLLSNDFKISQKEFSEIMARFHRDKWIESGPNNTVILHARTIIEMQSFITDIYSQYVYHCQICRRLLIRGLTCANSSCEVHLHRACAARYFHRLANVTNSSQARKDSYPCPACKKDWNDGQVHNLMQNSSQTTNKKQKTSNSKDSESQRPIRPSNRRFNNSNRDDDED